MAVVVVFDVTAAATVAVVNATFAAMLVVLMTYIVATT